ncbi:uncharacterized protein LOC129617689 [Condylostylus longicornis]|uniref:uncharacterized protein LOC129617689 n=1 Tax=Condylostylus longicornis TaxID=2530218 RepID=UPI00244E0D7C|nr:uncharacterized protein LOC129617689 [Condylostylus longicornis]
MIFVNYKFLLAVFACLVIAGSADPCGPTCRYPCEAITPGHPEERHCKQNCGFGQDWKCRKFCRCATEKTTTPPTTTIQDETSESNEPCGPTCRYPCEAITPGHPEERHCKQNCGFGQDWKCLHFCRCATEKTTTPPTTTIQDETSETNEPCGPTCRYPCEAITPGHPEERHCKQNCGFGQDWKCLKFCRCATEKTTTPPTTTIQDETSETNDST